MTYTDYIQNIINTRGQWNIPESEFFEMHHIKPRCIGGTGDYKNRLFVKYSHNENCIWLYPREHFIAHKLLAEENPDNAALVKAFWSMCTLNTKVNLDMKPEEYEKARLLIHNVPGVYKNCKPEDHPMYGKDRSGKNNPFYGKTFSDETRKKLGDHLKEWKATHPEEFSKNQARPLGANGRAIPIRCVETDQYFACLKLAIDWLTSVGIEAHNRKKISEVLDTDNTAYGYHWKSAERLNYKKEHPKSHGWWTKYKK